jgi:hypothetical protein
MLAVMWNFRPVPPAFTSVCSEANVVMSSAPGDHEVGNSGI